MPDAERGKESLAELHGSLAGDALAPGDAAYDKARGCFNAMIDRRPAVIARCRGAGDVATAFDAAEHGMNPAALAVAWTIRPGGVSAAIVGMRRPAHADSIVPAADLVLDRATLDALDAQ